MQIPVPDHIKPGDKLRVTAQSHLVSSTFPAGSIVEVVEILSRQDKPPRHGLTVMFSDPVGEPNAIWPVKPEEVEELE